MTDLREAVARAINDVPCPQVVDGQPATESVCLALADAALRAIEAAGYAVVPKRLAVTTNPDLLAEARIASLADTPLTRET